MASLQWDIYALWWKLSYVTANAANPIPNAQQVITAALTAKQAAAAAGDQPPGRPRPAQRDSTASRR